MLNGLNRFLKRSKSLYTRDDPAYASHTIGEWTYGKPSIMDWKDGATLTVGRFCSIARGVTILLGGEHRLDWLTTYPFTELWKAKPNGEKIKTSRSKGNVTIRNDVWIGTQALVLSGVTIGNGAVIGACSVVTKDVPPYGIVVGNPARLIRLRFDSATIDSLQRIAWWDWPVEKIKEAQSYLLSSDIHSFVRKYG